MYYYFVWVRSNRYHGAEALTYASSQRLKAGQIIQVELQRKLVLAVISGLTTEPRFKTKEITRVFDLPLLPAHLLRLSNWLQEYYPAPLGIQAQQLLPVSFSEKQLDKPALTDFTKPDLKKLPPLTKEQKAALAGMADQDTYLLHGATGSGKTRLYIELAAQAVAVEHVAAEVFLLGKLDEALGETGADAGAGQEGISCHDLGCRLCVERRLQLRSPGK